MKSPTCARLGPIALEILAYLSTHRDAQDTAEGIAEWWLLEQHIRHVKTEIKDALAELIAQGVILERPACDGRVHYRLNPRKRGFVPRLVGEEPKESFAAPVDASSQEDARQK